jgi:hypothetical protein
MAFVAPDNRAMTIRIANNVMALLRLNVSSSRNGGLSSGNGLVKRGCYGK